MAAVPDRRRLRAALATVYPWVTDTELGPRSVEAGECDRCGRQPRVVATCGPVAWSALCAGCVETVGAAAFCEGHAAEAGAAAAWVRRLPDEWAQVARLWWVATGEVRLDRLVLDHPERLAPAVQAALRRPTGR